MPLYDYTCDTCKVTEEKFASLSEEKLPCPYCGGSMVRQFSPMGAGAFNEDAAWIRTVLEVVDKDSKAPHVVEFLRHPTRSTYRAWMKAEGIRPREEGEQGHRPSERQSREHHQRITNEVMKKHMARKKIYIGGH